MSAFFLWMNECGRTKVKAAYPELANRYTPEVTRKCGEEWRNMTEGEKNKFRKKQKEHEKKFDKEFKEWLENGGEKDHEMALIKSMK